MGTKSLKNNLVRVDFAREGVKLKQTFFCLIIAFMFRNEGKGDKESDEGIGLLITAF